MSCTEVNPGASVESVLVTTDSCENFEQMSSSLEEIKNYVGKSPEVSDSSTSVDNLEESNSLNAVGSDDDYIRSKDWLEKKKHIFVLSSAGKPIYSRYGIEDKLVTMFGVMQALVSFVQDQNDTINCIHAGSTKYVFLNKNHLILVAISKTEESVPQLVSQLNYVFNQIASILTLTRLNKIYEQRRNYDLRRLLSGVERIIDHLLNFYEIEPALTLGAVQCLSLPPSIRDTISSAITQACSKIKNLVFAILLANNKLITLVRMKKYAIHPADLHLIFNLVQASESFKTVESWTPLCLPRFDASGFLYGHVSYLAEDCQACLLLLTVERDVFFTLSEAKHKIVEKMRRANCLEAINESLNSTDGTCLNAGFPELRHYIYKSKSTAQFHQPEISAPYINNTERLLMLYKRAHRRLHSVGRPLKLLFERSPQEAVLAWDTRGFELYVILEPLIETSAAIASVGKLLNWIKKREDKLFHLNAPTF
ncbi:PREDICTED: vacuolar fusion protein MON1 homolog A [Nicrophorus vespilloides]|uniref:Vacuolar fusion protein MON1 homolog n=1 Tax=Nicrophorus vespilloides TaxID=110193 RepID=A0ABM1MG43_NICVS|nr:PREDICTED: vacuolar fusion protein MON1 homolog A [Nicrophorus vespilloides]